MRNYDVYLERMEKSMQDKYGLPHFRTHRKLIMERVEKE